MGTCVVANLDGTRAARNKLDDALRREFLAAVQLDAASLAIRRDDRRRTDGRQSVAAQKHSGAARDLGEPAQRLCTQLPERFDHSYW